MKEIRWHGRGGQGAKSMSQVLAEAWLRQGRWVQAFPEYGPERSGAPVSAYTRADTRPIRIHHAVRNPDAVVVLDPSLLGEVPVAAGLRAGGFVLINSPDPASSLAERLPGVRVLRVDGSALARSVGSAYANVVLLGAVAGVMGEPSLEALQQAFAATFVKLSPEAIAINCKALEAGYRVVPEEAERPGLEAALTTPALRQDLPGAVVLAQGAPHPRTGGWRTGFKPAVRLEACVNCLLCWVYCPDAAILTENQTFVGFDYQHCKGCELCVRVCPTSAIEMVPEGLELVGQGQLLPGGRHA